MTKLVRDTIKFGQGVGNGGFEEERQELVVNHLRNIAFAPPQQA